MKQYIKNNINSIKEILNLSLKLKEENDTGILPVLINKKEFLLKTITYSKKEDLFYIRLLPINILSNTVFGDNNLHKIRIKALDDFEVAIIDKNYNDNFEDKDYYYNYSCSHLNIKLAETNKFEHDIAFFHNLNHDKKGNNFFSLFLEQQLNLDKKIIVK